MIELFDDIVPAAASHLRNRCLPGTSAPLGGTTFHKLLPRFALHGGQHPKAAADGIRLQQNRRLRHVEPGAVSVSLGGDEVVVALAAAPPLDATHQVVGRVHLGAELLDRLGDLPTRPDDSPVDRLAISRTGPTNAKGDYEALGDDGDGAGPSKDAAALAQEASASAREAVIDALREATTAAAAASGPQGAAAAAALKRKAPAAAGDGAADGGGEGAAAAGAGVAAGGGGRNVRSKMLDSMLMGDLSESSSDSEEAV